MVPVGGYRFAEEVMKMAIMMYVYGGISFRSAERCMEIVPFVFPFLHIEIPSHVTIRDWILKAGLDTYRNRCRGMSAGETYHVIMDESITIAEHKLLLSLAAPADHPGSPLGHSDVEVVDIHVSASHKCDDVAEAVGRIAKVAGRKPEYATTDNGTPLVKGLGKAGVAGHRDISHTFGTYLKAVYDRDSEFISLTKAIGGARHFALTDVDYLMPCNMRALARYMNVFNWVHWAKSIMESTDRLNRKERKMYSFVQEHAGLVDELYEVMNCFEKVLSLCKCRGLSKTTVNDSISIVNKMLMGRGRRMNKLGGMIVGYFGKESSLLKTDDESHNISSDIIESTFGYFKDRKSPNRMFGVTAYALVLPLHTKLCTLETARQFDFKARLECTHCRDVKDWQKENLPENLASKRAKILRIAC